jgi:iron complex outermembrane recepter protein
LTDAQLHVDIEGRIDRYSDSAAVINPLYNISWEALSFLKLESSYRTSSRPASLFDLSRPTLTQTIPIADPRQNGAIATPVVRAGGNPLLEPARGESWTAGFTLSPWADVTLAANYWQLRMTHRPVTLPLMTFLENEAYFANRIERVSGTLRFIDVSNINLGRVKVSGIDVNIHALLQTEDYGDFRGKLSGKWFDEYSMEDIPGIVRVERVGLASPIGTIPRMKGLASLEWLGSTLSVKATVLHTAGYEDVSLGRRTGRSLSPQTILNLQGTVDFTHSSHMTEWLDGTRFTLGIQNVMDRSPDHADVGTAVGYDHSEWDLRQRFVFAGISKTFR